MKCYDCDRDAVGLCRSCLAGQCRDHLARTVTEHAGTPVLGCRHDAPESTLQER